MYFKRKKLFQELPSGSGVGEKKLTTIEVKTLSQEANTDLKKLKVDLVELQKLQISKEQADAILEKVKILKASEKIVGQKLTTLETGLQLILNDPKNPDSKEIIMGEDKEEIAKIQEQVLLLKQELSEISQESDALQRTLETLKKNQLTKEEQDQFKTIKNIDFLKMSPQERLRFITVGNITAEQVKTGAQKNLEFTFTYDGTFNRDLYIRTTLGQVLPPEVREVTAGSEVFIRSGLNGEFFTSEGKRLKIHEGTKLDVSKIGAADELKKLAESSTQAAKAFEGKPDYDIALEAAKRGIDPQYAILMYSKKLSSLSPEQRKNNLEDFLTDIARFQDDFADEFPGKKSFEGGKVSEAFAGFMGNIISADMQVIASTYGYTIDGMNKYKKQNRYSGGGAINMANVSMEGVSQQEIQEILKMKRFTPGSKEAIILFTVAAKAANLPETWGKSSELHRILSRESNGQVGRLNYTIPKSISSEEFKRVSIERGNNNPIGVISTASGLGQLLLTNVDKYYPDGRNGIGDALNEAVGMLRYIHDRYGSPEVAGEAYGRVCSYRHAVTGKLCNKTYREGY